jgi:hypothetical protein
MSPSLQIPNKVYGANCRNRQTTLFKINSCSTKKVKLEAEANEMLVQMDNQKLCAITLQNP